MQQCLQAPRLVQPTCQGARPQAAARVQAFRPAQRLSRSPKRLIRSRAEQGVTGKAAACGLLHMAGLWCWRHSLRPHLPSPLACAQSPRAARHSRLPTALFLCCGLRTCPRVRLPPALSGRFRLSYPLLCRHVHAPDCRATRVLYLAAAAVYWPKWGAWRPCRWPGWGGSCRQGGEPAPCCLLQARGRRSRWRARACCCSGTATRYMPSRRGACGGRLPVHK